jgi:hypothetical protein
MEERRAKKQIQSVISGYRRSTDKTAAFPQAFSQFRMRWASLNKGVAFTG